MENLLLELTIIFLLRGHIMFVCFNNEEKTKDMCIIKEKIILLF